MAPFTENGFKYISNLRNMDPHWSPGPGVAGMENFVLLRRPALFVAFADRPFGPRYRLSSHLGIISRIFYEISGFAK